MLFNTQNFILIMKNFEETLPWQKTQEFANEAYAVLENSKEQWFKEEILETAFLAGSNVARGHEKYNDEENIKYLGYAKDSLIKCRSMIFMAEKMSICDEKNSRNLQEKATSAFKVINGLIKHIREKKAA